MWGRENLPERVAGERGQGHNQSVWRDRHRVKAWTFSLVEISIASCEFGRPKQLQGGSNSEGAFKRSLKDCPNLLALHFRVSTAFPLLV